MKKIISLFVAILLLQEEGHTQTDLGKPYPPFTNLVDLSHTLNAQFPYMYPAEGFRLDTLNTVQEDGFAGNRWFIHEHLGTQFDAPRHWISDGLSADQILVENLVVPAVVINIAERTMKDPDASVTVEDIIDWEKEHGRIPTNSCVIMYSGWERHLGTDRFIGRDENGILHFPSFTIEAANFLIENRDISGIGVDCLSLDPGLDTTFRTHIRVLGAGKWGLEALANLDKLPAKGAYIFVGAPKIEDATGGIARVIAFW